LTASKILALVVASLTASLAARASEPDAAASDATAPSLRVVIIAPEAAFERALRRALTPWSMRVSALTTEAPGDVMPASSTRARTMAEAEGADALVWISSNSEGRALWVYDVRSDSVSARPVPPPPFSEARAAALALSVKTVLRAPLEAPELAEPAAPPLPAVSALSDQPEAEAEDASVSPARLQLVLGGSARLNASQPALGNVRQGFQLRWAPFVNDARWAALWLGVGAEVSVPRTLRDEVFRGEYWQLAPELGVGISAHANRWLVWGFGAIASVEYASLSGTVLASGDEARHARFSPALQLRPELGVVWGRASLLLQPGAGVFLRRQRYYQGDEDVLQTKPFWWTLGASIGLRID
jgi:hypothetical protein